MISSRSFSARLSIQVNELPTKFPFSSMGTVLPPWVDKEMAPTSDASLPSVTSRIAFTAASIQSSARCSM